MHSCFKGIPCPRFTSKLSFYHPTFESLIFPSGLVINVVSDDLKIGRPAEQETNAITRDGDAKSDTLLGGVISSSSESSS